MSLRNDAVSAGTDSTVRSAMRWMGPAAALLSAGLCQTASAETLEEQIAGGTVNADLRLRYESVEQDNASKDADAVTLRTVLGYTTKPWNGVAAFVEMEDVTALGNDYSPNEPGYSTVLDPEGTEVNQGGLRYTGIPNLTATVGRSKVILDNARWVGNVGWRQNEQTYDGAFLKYAPTGSLTLQYAYVSNVNTIAAANDEVDGHLLNASWVVAPALTLTGYGYWLDFDAATATDYDTYGLRAAGKLPLGDLSLLYTAEYASQDADTATDSFSADYLLGELGLGYKKFAVQVGYELLGSDDGAFALQTPLATKHAFNGWADAFLTTPVNGLEDTYVSASAGIEKFKLNLVYHDFKSDEGSADYGTEWDAIVTRPLVGKLVGGVKYASYDADDFGVDTDKLWVWMQYKF